MVKTVICFPNVALIANYAYKIQYFHNELPHAPPPSLHMYCGRIVLSWLQGSTNTVVKSLSHCNKALRGSTNTVKENSSQGTKLLQGSTNTVVEFSSHGYKLLRGSTCTELLPGS